MSVNSNYRKKMLHVSLSAAVAASATVAFVPNAQAEGSESSSFKDVKPQDHFYEAVKSLQDRGIVTGYGDEFRPYTEVTRAQAAKIIALALHLDTKNVQDPGFSDVAKDGWSYGYIAALANKGIVKGYGDQFKPNEPLSRAQVAKIIALAFEFKQGTLENSPFTDVNKDDWYTEFVKPLLDHNITTGTTSTTFSPNNKVTRGQMASFIFRSEKAAESSEDDNFNLALMHTNDTHAHIDNIARRVTAIKQVRAEHANSLLLDAGDVFSGTLYFNEYKGQADLEFMNYIGYDAMTFGNHEFDLGTETLAKFVENAKFPFVSANVNFSKDGNLKDRFNDELSTDPLDGEIYNGIVKEVDGEKIGIFGLTTAETKDISSPGDDVEFENYIEEAQKAVQQFEAQGIDKIIALTHIGYQDGGGDNDATLAKEVEGIDVIVGGHSHDKLEAPVVDMTGEEPTVIVQANEYSKFLGVLDVEFDENGQVVEHNGELIDIDQKASDEKDAPYVFQDDAEAAKILAEKYKPAVDAFKQTIVGTTAVALDGERANVRTKETNLGNLITDGMLAKAKTINPNTVIALQNGGGIRASIDSGDMTLSEILTVLPFGNSLGIMELTGQEIIEALEHSVASVPAEQSGAFLQVSGLKFTYDSGKKAGERVVAVEVKEDGRTYVALNPEKKYFVATNTFTAKGGDSYTVFKKAYEEGRLSEPGFVDWEMFKDYFTANPTAIPAVEGRIVDIAQK
ncbi:5'-nucleotidase C-terminal domain-containing protein [Priestia abyssalis]|uniref:5'-nucleotidase C-terminal domain-containing protein n=1 Tax=Priestia abyssalis TaxID=1221450 RepID=UPI000995B544|nr:5'-nucleotidase C-terminal domain-containing protein [Priestia abyssalis]